MSAKEPGAQPSIQRNVSPEVPGRKPELGVSITGKATPFKPPLRRSMTGSTMWATVQSHKLNEKKVQELKSSGVKLQDKEKFTSVSQCVDFLNCPEDPKYSQYQSCLVDDCCIVYSANSVSYFLIYARGSQKDAYRRCGIEPEWDIERCKPCKVASMKLVEDQILERVHTAEQAVDLLNYPYDQTRALVVYVADYGVFHNSKEMRHYVLWKKGMKDKALQNTGIEIIGEEPAKAAGWSAGFRSFFGQWGNSAAEDEEKKAIEFKSEMLVATITKPLKERYKVIKDLGCGAQGTTRLVQKLNTKLEEDENKLFVAKESNDHSKEARLAFQTEFERMKALRHPNCLKVIELISTEKQQFIITEFARGGDLFHYMRTMREEGEQISELKLAKMFNCAMLGLAYLHDQKYIHNDLKPENILVMDPYQKDTAPRLVVADYGCVTVQGDKNKVFFGDPRYLCPEAMSSMMEHLEGKKITTNFQTVKVDIWAMGATIYEVLSGGLLPFIYRRCALHDLAGMYTELLAQVTNMDIEVKFDLPELSEANFTPDARKLLKLMLDKSTDKRGDAADILKESWWENCSERSMSQLNFSDIRFADTRSRVRQILRNAVAAKLHYDHVHHCFEIFQRYDPDNSGTISREEFVKAWKELPNAPAEADTYFSQADVDKNESLEFNEFAAITIDWLKLKTTDLDEHLLALLNSLGATTNDESDIQVDCNQFLKLFQGLDKTDGTELKEAIAEIDENGDGFITLKELREFVQGSGFISGDRKKTTFGQPVTIDPKELAFDKEDSGTSQLAESRQRATTCAWSLQRHSLTAGYFAGVDCLEGD